MGRALSDGGFDAARDIAAITVNRWPHGYAGAANDLYDPEWSYDEVPWVVGRKRFGRIAIANSDAAATSLTHAAIDQGHRAVQELLTDVIRPSFSIPGPNDPELHMIRFGRKTQGDRGSDLQRSKKWLPLSLPGRVPASALPPR